jgi:hypothetical protein
MRPSAQTKRRTLPPPRPVQPALTFICTACETPHHSRTPELPKNWAVETVRNDVFVYCPDCAIDLPRAVIQ